MVLYAIHCIPDAYMEPRLGQLYKRILEKARPALPVRNPLVLAQQALGYLRGDTLP